MKKALGKGLSALIPDSYADDPKPTPQMSGGVAIQERAVQESKGFRTIPIDSIQTNHDQPRKEFIQSAIEELAASIKEQGILQPVIVKMSGDNQYELICGERRLRAAKHCGLKEVPVVIKDIAQEKFLEWALIENIQRQDLNPLEEAEAYQRLAEERMLSQDDIAKKVGKNRTTITNTLRLLRLPEDVRNLIESGLLSAGHARALLGLITPEHQRQMAKRIVEEGLSVRQIEAIVNRSNAHKRKPKSARRLSAEIIDLEKRLEQHLGTRVKIYPRKNQEQGRIEMYYFSLDDFDRILDVVGLPAEKAS